MPLGSSPNDIRLPVVLAVAGDGLGSRLSGRVASRSTARAVSSATDGMVPDLIAAADVVVSSARWEANRWH